MSYNPEIHHRRTIRLKDYDYSSSGAYFITICVDKRECLFGEIINGIMNLSEIGKIANNNWLEIPEHSQNVELGEFVIMPNHLHGIIILNGLKEEDAEKEDVKYYVPTDHEKQTLNPNDNVRRDVLLNVQDKNKNEHFSKLSPAKNTISIIIRSFKASVTHWCRKNNHEYFKWQKNYHEHVIRSENSLNAISKYIIENPLKWDIDNENPDKK